MSEELNWPTDLLEAAIACLGFKLLLYKEYKLDDHELRKFAMNLADDFLNGRMSAEDLIKVHEEYEKKLDDPAFWNLRGTEEFDNVQVVLSLTDLRPLSEEIRLQGIDNTIVYIQSKGRRLANAGAMFDEYFKNYTPRLKK